MFGRDPITPVAKLLEPRPRYYGERGSALKMDTLRRLYTVVVQNIRKAREKLPKKEDEHHSFKVNDMVLVKDPDAAVFKPRYQANFRVTAIFGKNRIEVQDECGHKSSRRSAHVKYIAPSEKVVNQLPSEQVLKNYGRSSKLLLAEKNIPDLHFDVTDTKEKGDSSEKTEVMEIIDVNTKRSVMAPQNSDSQEHSRNPLEIVADGALHRINQHGNVEKKNCTVMPANTENILKKSQSSGKETDMKMSGNIVHQTLGRCVYPGYSENQEHSQNSPEKQAVDEMEHVNVTMSVQEDQCSLGDSDFSNILKTRCQKVNQKWTKERRTCLLVIMMASVW